MSETSCAGQLDRQSADAKRKRDELRAVVEARAAADGGARVDVHDLRWSSILNVEPSTSA